MTDLRDSFFSSAPTLKARAPGRIEFIGNHTDYNGGEVLGAAIDRYVTAELALREDQRIRLMSSLSERVVDLSMDAVEPQSGEDSWANYPLGVFTVLRNSGIEFERGFEIYFDSDLPLGAGLSSSAAIELATLEALCAQAGVELERSQRVLLAQKAENDFVGVPCGMLDQAVSCFGNPDQLVHIDCAQVRFASVPMPSGYHFWIFNSQEKHSLVDSLYAERNRECKAALAALQGEYPQWKQLVDASPEVIETLLADQPALRRRAQHVVNEHRRVQECLKALAAGDMDRVGELLYASHDSSRDLFENSTPALDGLVDSLRGQPGVCGARLTGGGFGGAAMALTTAAFKNDHAQAIVDQYRNNRPAAPEPAVIHVQTGEGSGVLLR
ncbi:MAG: galactokinase [Opitutales bacterium]|nr:galactokinase [Opitutales bacterium]